MYRHAARRQALALTTLLTALLLVPVCAHAGSGVSPNGETLAVATDGSGYVGRPSSVNFTVTLDHGDSDPSVWVSTAAERTSSGTPVGTIVGSCGSGSLRAAPDPGTYTCTVSTILMRPATRYYWWLFYTATEEGGVVAHQAISGPFSFTLHAYSGDEQQQLTSTKTMGSAALLPAQARFTGARSINDTALARIVANTMKATGRPPRRLSVVCWTRGDFSSVLAAVGRAASDGSTDTFGVWFASQPHRLHLTEEICADAQRLLDTKVASGRNAQGLVTLLHEAMHAYGIRNEAQANCLAVQLTPIAAGFAGLTTRRARYLGILALNYTRDHAPASYWDTTHCRDGGAWDTAPDQTNLR
jgi:hypothetical protein